MFGYFLASNLVEVAPALLVPRKLNVSIGPLPSNGYWLSKIWDSADFGDRLPQKDDFTGEVLENQVVALVGKSKKLKSKWSYNIHDVVPEELEILDQIAIERIWEKIDSDAGLTSTHDSDISTPSQQWRLWQVVLLVGIFGSILAFGIRKWARQ